MSAPNVAENSLTFEEMEAATQNPATPPAPDSIKLEGEQIPEAFRGKSVAEVFARNQALEESLRLSESARIALQQSTERPAAPAQPTEPPPPQYQFLTREQLAEMYQEDPLKAVEIMTAQNVAMVEQQYARRFAQLEAGTMSSAENWARQEFADEFKILGKEINDLVAKIPDKSVFGTKQAWEDAVTFVRGKSGNFEKLMEYRQTRKEPRTPEVARAEQQQESGFSGRPVMRSSSPAPVGDLDPVTVKIAENLFPNLSSSQAVAEWKKWNNIGSQT